METHLEGHDRGNVLNQRGNLKNHIRGTPILFYLAVHLRQPEPSAEARDEPGRAG